MNVHDGGGMSLKKRTKKKTTPTSRERNEGWYDERAK